MEKHDEEVLRRAALTSKTTIDNNEVSLADAKKKTVNGFMWRFFEKWGAQAIVFVVSIILARRLAPGAYGTVALATVFTSILAVFIDSGMGVALIQKKNADDLDFSSMFYFNVFMCLTLYVIVFFTAPLVAKFYGNSDLTALVRVCGLTLIVSGVKSVQHAYISRHMLFKRFFFASLGGTLIAAAVGISMAYMGYGAWAIVMQNLVDATLDTIILWFTVKWRPKKMFSFLRLKGLFSYGWKMLVSGLIDTVYNKLRTLIIGKQYSEDDLAFYHKGDSFPSLFVTNINTAIDSVLLPTMSKAQDDKAVVRQMTRRSIKTSTYILMPIMMGLAVCAEPVIRILFTAKWLPCVFFLRVFCFSYAFYPIHTANLNAIKAVGRSDIFLKLEIIKKTVNIAAILATMFISVKAMALSVIFTSISGQIINSWPNKKLLGYSYLNQVKDMLPSILLSCFMGAVVYSVTLLPVSNDWLILAIQVPLGIMIYVLGSILFKMEIYHYLLEGINEWHKKLKMKRHAR
ncbi:MAG: lipopolysaccharide biosynthesis protein [Clostridia bacterium]|nr:lipopolysaccharide biosynthesis protein [Clostridia bacterium]